LFGPVIRAEPITGRVEDGDGGIVLLEGGSALVTIDLAKRSAARVDLQIPNAHCSGLARLQDGTLWTLKDRGTLAQIDRAGRLVQEIALGGPHLGLFSVGAELLYEETNIPPPAPVFRAGPPGPRGVTPWSDLTMRPFVGFNRGAVMALNLVSCGIGRRGEMPCWFPDEPAVSLVQPSGRTRRIELTGLYHVTPEALIASDAPPRPVRDVYLDDADVMWVLSSGEPPRVATDTPGGRVIARYRPTGIVIDQRRLEEPIRLILRVESGRAVLLTGAGMVAELPQ
jgi:hypothetical protein